MFAEMLPRAAIIKRFSKIQKLSKIYLRIIARSADLLTALLDSVLNEIRSQTQARFPRGRPWGKKVVAKSICGDIVDRSRSRSLEQLMDQDSINIDNGENQANKRSWYTTRARGCGIRVCLTLRCRFSSWRDWPMTSQISFYDSFLYRKSLIRCSCLYDLFGYKINISNQIKNAIPR